MKTKRSANGGLETTVAMNRANEDLMRTISMYVPGIQFEKKGKVYQAKCPFDIQEETRFYVWPEKQTWFTYGGMESFGDILTFVMQLKGLYPKDAMNDIVERIGKITDEVIDIDLYSVYQDFLFFKNGAVRITGSGLERIPLEKINPNPDSDHIIDHSICFINDLFLVKYSESYITCTNDTDIDPLDKFTLKCNWGNFSYAQFLYNTGNRYWREQQKGLTLTERQEKEIAYNFISKVCALGYACRRYKDPNNAYMLMALESLLNPGPGKKAGVGKSLFYLPVKYVRNVYMKDGNLIKNSDLIYSGVEQGKTDVVLYEDLYQSFSIKPFFNGITGDMVARDLYQDSRNIPFEESPILVSTADDYPHNLDNSTLRRLWFLAFSDYYHIYYNVAGEHSVKPSTEFGKKILFDYTKDEMNQLYFFMCQCIQTYIHINERVQSSVV